MKNHRWSEADDLAALYVYLFGTDQIGIRIDDLARSRGIKPGSFRMRIKNIKAVDGQGGLSNFADQTERIFRKYGRYSEQRLRGMVFGLGG
jgi:hypothetical protein